MFRFTLQGYKIDSNRLSLTVHLRLLIHTGYFPIIDGTENQYGCMLKCIVQLLLEVVGILRMVNQLEI